MAIVVAPATLFLPAGVIGRDTLVYGDSDGEFGGHGAAPIFIYEAASSTLVSGDADAIDDNGRGGNDHFYAVGVGNAELSLLHGDASVLLASGHGGDDRLDVRASDLVPDADAVGDAYTMDGRSVGGDDCLRAHGSRASMAGDALELRAHRRGGNDVLIGSKRGDTLDGDAAVSASDHSVCGDDLINDGCGNDLLYGDAPDLASGVTVGDDRFVFQAGSGKDTIGDFQHGHDEIDVRQLGFDDISDLHVTSNGTDSVVHFHDVDQVIVLDVAGLHASDFLFA